MKTIALFGANGKIGLKVIELAILKGYEIKALVNEPLKLNFKHPNLIIITGDVLKSEDVKKAIKGSHIVVSLFGNMNENEDWYQTDGTRNIVAAMKRYNVKRIITLSDIGLLFPELDNLRLTDHLAHFFLKIAAPRLYYDSKGQLEILAKSGLNWVNLRKASQSNPSVESYKVGAVKTGKPVLKIKNEELADFIVGQFEGDTLSSKHRQKHK